MDIKEQGKVLARNSNRPLSLTLAPRKPCRSFYELQCRSLAGGFTPVAWGWREGEDSKVFGGADAFYGAQQKLHQTRSIDKCRYATNAEGWRIGPCHGLALFSWSENGVCSPKQATSTKKSLLKMLLESRNRSHVINHVLSSVTRTLACQGRE